MENPILIIGRESKVASTILECFPDALTTSRNGNGIFHLDMSKPTEDLHNLPYFKKVIICAALSGEARCKDNPELAVQINVNAPKEIAKYFIPKGVDVIYLSSDLVGYDNGIYSTTKLSGERAVKAEGGRILRLGKILFSSVDDIFKIWTQQLLGGECIRAFSNRWLAPICDDNLKFGFNFFLDNQIEEGALISNCYISYAQAAQHIAKKIGCSSYFVEAVERTYETKPLYEPSKWFQNLDPFDVLDAHLKNYFP